MDVWTCGADLRGGEVVVEDDDVGFFLGGQVGDFYGFAGAEVGGRVDAVAALHDLADDFGAGRFGEGDQFAEWVAGVGVCLWQQNADEDGAFLFDGKFGAFEFGQGVVPP